MPHRLSVDDAGRWAVRRWTASTAELHAAAAPDPARPEVWVVEVTDAALVLGSSQRGLADPLRHWVDDHGVELEVVVRRSGGGVVFVAPGEQVWIEVFVPHGDARWSDDVRASAGWLGEAWAEALAAVLPGRDIAVHHGGLDRTPWSELVCFGGAGPGEVLLDGHKVVGISQRRGRSVARFQCTALLQWQPEVFGPLGELVGVELPGSLVELRAVAAAIPVDAAALTAAVLRALQTR